MLFEFLHKYCVTLNDNVTFYSPKTYLKAQSRGVHDCRCENEK